MELTKKRDLSYWTVLFLIVLITYCHFTNPRQKNEFFTNELAWDVTTYYLYLPFTFIYHDIGIQHHEAIDKIWDTYHPSPTQYQIYKLENGNWTMNYTCGFAILQAPFFFIGHLWALNSHQYPADGFSFPYQFSIANGVMLYIFLGLFVLRRVLLHFFSSTIATLTLLMLVTGTNYFIEAFGDNLQPHAMLFAGYAILLYCTIKWHEAPRKKYITIAGFVMGLMILARPSEIVCLSIPLLWGVYNKESFRQKWLLIKNHRSHFGLLVMFAFIPIIPQIIYWKVVTGHWLFYSYAQTEGFDFDSPHVMNVLFSFRNSLLIYSPILIFPIIGIFLLKKYNKYIFLALTVYFVTNFYLLSSWPGWWNIRYYVQSYAVISIPFGFMLQYLSGRKLFVKIIAGLIMAFFVFMGLFQTWQLEAGVTPFDRMTFQSYKRVFLKTRFKPEWEKYLAVQRNNGPVEEFTNEQEYNHFTIAHYNFENINSTPIEPENLDSTHCISPPYSYRMGPDQEYGLTYKIRYDHLVKPDRDHVWLRVTVNYLSETDIKDNIAVLVLEQPHKKYSQKYASYGFERFPSKTGQWNTLHFDWMTPYPYSQKNFIKIYLWHRGKKNIYFDDIHVEAFERKPFD